MNDKKQLEAFNKALDNDMSIISGKAGVGKTYVALMISDALKEKGWNVSRVAPTGKAALRARGKTIHSWLSPEVEEDNMGNVKILGFNRNEFEFKEALIVDEASMIDDKLWNEIMKCYNNTTGDKKLIFVGDDAQLEPVGDGTPYIDAIASEDIPSTILETVHRTKDGNDIVDLAHAIRSNSASKSEYNNVKKITLDDTINKVYENEDVQIICPMNKNLTGAKNVNAVIQKKIGNDKELLSCISWNNEEKTFKPNGTVINKNDKVLITKNHFGLDITNGTVGKALRKGIKNVLNTKYNIMEPQTGIFVERDFDKKELFVPIKFAEKNMQLGWALTVHKAQGSEWKEVIFMTTSDQAFMLKNKKLLYTAITRASEMLYLVK